MLKLLIKKQVLELGSLFLQGKEGVPRRKAVVLLFIGLILFSFLSVAAMFWILSSVMCKTFVEAGHGWVYFAMMGITATSLGIVGGVFMAKFMLYEAKDNDLLLSFPIPPWVILFVRVMGLYLFTLPFEACVLIPTMINYLLVTGFSLSALVCGVFLTLALPFLAVAICCFLGFLLSWLVERLPFKNLFIVLVFLVFMVGYSLVMAKVNEYLGYVFTHGEEIGEAIAIWLYPFLHFGYGGMGNVLSSIIFVGIVGALFAIVYSILSWTYVYLVTNKRGEVRARYKEKESKCLPPQVALFKKEFWRLVKSPGYLLNASIGSMIMIIVAVMMAIYGDFFGVNADMVASMPELQEAFGLIVAGVVCLMAAMNFISASSVSLEGESLSIIQSMPVDEWVILKAKLYLHIMFTAIPDAILGLAISFVMELEWFMAIGVVLTALLASVLFAALGLFYNLKFPKLHWKNETMVVKQGISSGLALLSGVGSCGLVIGGYFLLGSYLPAPLYLYLCLFLFLIATMVLLIWLKKRGTEIFKNLSV